MFRKIISTILALFILLIFYFLLNNYGYFSNAKEKAIYDKLSKYDNKNLDPIMLKDVADFEWDYVCFISSYQQEMTKNEYEKIVGFEFEGQVPKSYGSSEGQTLFLFINQNTKTSLLVNFDNLEEKNNLKKLCAHKDEIVLKPENSKKYRKGFFVFNHKFTINSINF